MNALATFSPRTSSARSTSWTIIFNSAMVIVGSLLSAFAYSLFQVPYDLAAGGIGGIGIILNHITGWPVGTLYFLLNIPLIILGYFHLGRLRFVMYTGLGIIVFSVATDLFVASLPSMLTSYPITENMLLSAVYAGLVGGIGLGFIYRAGGTLGSTGVLGRILQNKTGIPMSQLLLSINGVVIIMSGIIFNWEIALNAMVTVFFFGLASDFVLEGPSTIRTATIITDCPDTLTQSLMDRLHRGVSAWSITGGYTGQAHTMLLCTVGRPQVNELKQIVASVDPQALLIIGNAQQALGMGFFPFKPSMSSPA